MNSDEKKVARLALSIVRRTIELANKHGGVLFEEDWGNDRSLTLAIPKTTHTHVGLPDTSYGMTEEQFFAVILSGLENMDKWAEEGKEK